MIRICHHSKTVGYSGTDKTAQIFCAELNKLPNFEAFLVYQANGDTSLLEEAKRLIGEDKVIPYHHIHQKNPPPPYLPLEDNLKEVLADINPDIVHLHRSGRVEWPHTRDICPTARFVETNIFGEIDRTGFIDLHLYISDFIRNRALKAGGADGLVLYNPCLPPIAIRKEARPKWLSRFELNDDAILFGRIGRPDNFSPISLKAFKEIEWRHPNAYYLVVNPCSGWYNMARKLRLKNVRFIDPIVLDRELSEFYASLDVYAHARVDGECQPCNINEAAYHGLPVITHIGQTYQGHVEQVNSMQGLGFVARDFREYFAISTTLCSYEERRKSIGTSNQKWASENVDAKVITERLANVYKELIHA